MRSGMERLERVELLAGADEEDRLAGDGRGSRAPRRRGRRRRSCVRIDARRPAVGPRSPARRSTASWPVIASATRSTWFGVTACDHALELAHQLVVDRAGGRRCRRGRRRVPAVRAAATPSRRDRDGVAALARSGCTGTPSLLRERRQLLDRGGPVDVGGDEVRAAPALVAQMARELGGRRRLAGAVQADEHHHDRWGAVQVERDGLARRACASARGGRA